MPSAGTVPGGAGLGEVGPAPAHKPADGRGLSGPASGLYPHRSKAMPAYSAEIRKQAKKKQEMEQLLKTSLTKQRRDEEAHG